MYIPTGVSPCYFFFFFKYLYMTSNIKIMNGERLYF